MVGSPTSPAWRMWSTPARAGRSSGRRRPWASETTPMSRLEGLAMMLEALAEAGAGVEVVAEAVADEVEGEDAEGEGDGGEEH